MLKESGGKPKSAKGGVMMPQVVAYRSLSKAIGALILGTVLSFILGFYLALIFQPVLQVDWLSFLGVFLGLPVILNLLASFIGWRQKKGIVEYHAPDWEFEPVQFTIDDTKSLRSTYNRKYALLVANSNFWVFFLPILLIILITTLPLYSFYEDLRLLDYVPILHAISVALLFFISLFGAFRATSNSASADFNLPLIREALKLAEIQSKVPGITYVRIVLDKAEDGDLMIYDNPRVVIRIESIEKDAYIESWSDDLNALTRVLCRLYEKDEKPQVIWWWMSTDRNFRKYMHPDDPGYYVKQPVKTKVLHPGVRDVSLVTRNAVALVINEYLKTRGEPKKLTDLLEQLKVENH